MQPHKPQRMTPGHPKPTPRILAPRPIASSTRSSATPQAAAPKPAPPPPPSKPPTPLPLPLTHNLTTLLTLATHAQSLHHGLSHGLFQTPTSHRAAQARLTHLRNTYHSLRPHVDRELAKLGHATTPNHAIPRAAPPRNVSARGPAQGTQKSKYGPTSPVYTVDKALKRKAEGCLGGFSSASSSQQEERASKKRKDSAGSDFVEGNEEEAGGQWPPEAITSLASVPLGRGERERMRGWRWKWGGAVRGGGEGEELQSPRGTRGWRWG